MAVTLSDVARHAGVSESTVSRVVRGVPVVSKQARVRVEKAIEALNYRPDVAARSIRTGASHAVGFVVPDISNGFYAMVYEGAQSALHDAGYELVIATSHGERERERTAIESLLARRIDGLILSLVDERARDLSATIATLPTVLLDREPIEVRADAILSDHAAGMNAAVRHLVGLGHRRIALLTGSPNLYTARSRRAEFHRAAVELGLAEPDLYDLAGDRSVAAGERKTRELMTSAKPPTAIIAGSNQLLRGVLLALNDLDLTCPRDVSLIACEDSDICRIYRPSISVVRRDVEALGGLIASRLLARLREAARAKSVDGSAPWTPSVEVTATEFVPRGSTASPPAARGRRVVGPRAATVSR